ALLVLLAEEKRVLERPDPDEEDEQGRAPQPDAAPQATRSEASPAQDEKTEQARGPERMVEAPQQAHAADREDEEEEVPLLAALGGKTEKAPGRGERRQEESGQGELVEVDRTVDVERRIGHGQENRGEREAERAGESADEESGQDDDRAAQDEEEGGEEGLRAAPQEVAQAERRGEERVQSRRLGVEREEGDPRRALELGRVEQLVDGPGDPEAETHRRGGRGREQVGRSGDHRERRPPLAQHGGRVYSKGMLSPVRQQANPGRIWLDEPAVREQIATRARAGELDAEEEAHLRKFAEDGYFIFPIDLSVADAAAIDRDVDALWTDRPANVAFAYDSPPRRFREAVAAKHRKPRYRIHELHTASETALRLYLDAKIHRYMSLILGETAVATQSLYFEFGSQQALHRDSVVVPTPQFGRLAAAWIALEDIAPESGPLMYVPGSQRLPFYEFEPGQPVYDPSRHTAADVEA